MDAPDLPALAHGLGELHVGHAVLEAGVRDLLFSADRADELLWSLLA